MSVLPICRLFPLLSCLQLLLGAELDALVQFDAWQSVCVLLELSEITMSVVWMPDYSTDACPVLNSVACLFVRVDLV